MPPVTQRAVLLDQPTRDLIEQAGKLLCREALDTSDEDTPRYDQERDELGKALQRVAHKFDCFPVPAPKPLDVDTTRLYERENDEIAAQEDWERQEEELAMRMWG